MVVAVWVRSLELLVINFFKVALFEVTHEVIVVVARIKLVDKSSQSKLFHRWNVVVVEVCVILWSIQVHAFNKQFVYYKGRAFFILWYAVLEPPQIFEISNQFFAEGRFSQFLHSILVFLADCCKEFVEHGMQVFGKNFLL